MISWSDMDTIRNQIVGYEPEILATSAADKKREYAKLAMRRLYARRRKAGLNAHGKPFSVKQRTNKKYVITNNKLARASFRLRQET